jgi:hypothetical protein
MAVLPPAYFQISGLYYIEQALCFFVCLTMYTLVCVCVLFLCACLCSRLASVIDRYTVPHFGANLNTNGDIFALEKNTQSISNSLCS